MFNRYIEQKNPTAEERKLYRLFRRNPLCFWRWYSYLTDDVYTIPYADWDEIKKRRPSVEKGKHVQFRHF